MSERTVMNKECGSQYLVQGHANACRFELSASGGCWVLQTRVIQIVLGSHTAYVGVCPVQGLRSVRRKLALGRLVFVTVSARWQPGASV